MRKKEDLLEMYRVAEYYYNENKSQQEIADILNVSRSQVSRLLILAREKGIVEIRVHMPETSSLDEIEQTLAEKLGIHRVLISRQILSENYAKDPETVLQENAKFAATMIPGLLRESVKIGIGRGKALYALSNYLPATTGQEDAVFVALSGNAGSRNKAMQISGIVSRFADRYGANGYYVNSALFRNCSDGVIQQTWYRELNEYWNSLDAAVITVGSLVHSMETYIEEAPDEVHAWGKDLKGASEILGQPVFPDLNRRFLEFDYIGISLEQLRKVPKTICVSWGEDRLKPIMDASREGLIHTLITDQETARGLLRLL